MRIGIAARADHVMDRPAMFIDPVPAKCVRGDCRHWTQMRDRGPEPFARGDMCAMQCACFAGKEAFGQIMQVVQVQITYLRPLNR